MIQYSETIKNALLFNFKIYLVPYPNFPETIFQLELKHMDLQ